MFSWPTFDATAADRLVSDTTASGGMIKPDDEPVFPGAYPIDELENASHSIPAFISKLCPKRSAFLFPG
jgi:hypothetical protein